MSKLFEPPSQTNATRLPSGEIVGRKAFPGKLVSGISLGAGGETPRRQRMARAATHKATAAPGHRSERTRDFAAVGEATVACGRTLSRTDDGMSRDRISKVGA